MNSGPGDARWRPGDSAGIAGDTLAGQDIAPRSVSVGSPNTPDPRALVNPGFYPAAQPDGSVGTDLTAIRQWAIAPTRTTKQPLIPPGSTFVTRFQAGHGWTGGTDLNNTEIVLLGSQDVKVVTTSGGSVNTSSPATLGLDLTSRTLWVLAYFDADPTGSSFYLYAGDATLANYYRFLIQPNGQLSGWQVFEFSWDTAVTTGAPSRAAIAKIQITIVAPAATILTMRLGAVGHRLVNQYPNGVLSFTFDHGYLSQYTLARPKLDQYGYPATLYAITSSVDDVPHTGLYVSEAQCHELENAHGWEIGAHCTSYAMHVDITTLTAAQLDAELSALRSWVLSKGFKGSDQYASPFGDVNEATSEAVLTYFRAFRLAGQGGAGSTIRGMYAPGRNRALWASGYDSVLTTVTMMKTEMDKFKANGLWGVFLFHEIVASPTATSQITPADFATIVDYASSIGIAVRTVTDAMNLV